jgi:hypothetical protein
VALVLAEFQHVAIPDPGPLEVGTLSIHRAFVLRLYADPDLANERIHGLVEHVVTGEGGEFRSVGDLLRFIARVLDANRETSPDVLPSPRAAPPRRARRTAAARSKGCRGGC